MDNECGLMRVSVLPMSCHISAVCATHTDVFVSCHDGSVRRYCSPFGLGVAPNAAAAATAHLILSAVQLEVIERLGILLVLSAGRLCMLSATSLQRIGEVELLEDVHVKRFCVRSDARRVEVFAATKNRLLVSEALPPYTHLAFTPLPHRSLFLPGIPQQLAWVCTSLCVVFPNEFSLLDVDTGKVENVWYFDEGRPLTANLSSAQLFVSSSKTAFILSVQPEGAKANHRLRWRAPPIALGSTQGLVLASFLDIVDIVALRSSGALSSDPKWVSVQSLSVKDVGIIVTSDRSVILADRSRLHFFVPIPPTLKVRDFQWLQNLESASAPQTPQLVSEYLIFVLASTQHPLGASVVDFVQSVRQLCHSKIASDRNSTIDSVCADTRVYLSRLRQVIFEVWPVLKNDLCDVVDEVIEQAMFPCMSDFIFPLFRTVYSTEDVDIQCKMQALKHLRLLDLGSSLCIDEINSSPSSEYERFHSPISLLQSLNEKQCPIDKLKLLTLVCHEIRQIVVEIWQSSSQQSGVKDLNADELIPLLAFVLIHGLQFPFANLKYMLEFINPTHLRGRLGYSLVSMEISLEHIKSLEPEVNDQQFHVALPCVRRYPSELDISERVDTHHPLVQQQWRHETSPVSTDVQLSTESPGRDSENTFAPVLE